MNTQIYLEAQSKLFYTSTVVHFHHHSLHQ